MKKIEAIIKPFKLDEVKEALQEVGLQGCFHAARGAKVVRPSVLAGSRAKSVFALAGEHDDPERVPSSLPQKQGLCQVVKVPDFEMLSDF